MLDLKWVVANLPEVRRRLATRNDAAAEALAPIEALSIERRQLILSSETERAEQKKASEQMRTLKGEEQAQLRARLKTLSDGVKEKDGRLKFFKTAKVVEFENAGHWVHHDRLDAFVDTVRGFIR